MFKSSDNSNNKKKKRSTSLFHQPPSHVPTKFTMEGNLFRLAQILNNVICVNSLQTQKFERDLMRLLKTIRMSKYNINEDKLINLDFQSNKEDTKSIQLLLDVLNGVHHLLEDDEEEQVDDNTTNANDINSAISPDKNTTTTTCSVELEDKKGSDVNGEEISSSSTFTTPRLSEDIATMVSNNCCCSPTEEYNEINNENLTYSNNCKYNNNNHNNTVTKTNHSFNISLPINNMNTINENNSNNGGGSDNNDDTNHCNVTKQEEQEKTTINENITKKEELNKEEEIKIEDLVFSPRTKAKLTLEQFRKVYTYEYLDDSEIKKALTEFYLTKNNNVIRYLSGVAQVVVVSTLGTIASAILHLGQLIQPKDCRGTWTITFRKNQFERNVPLQSVSQVLQNHSFLIQNNNNGNNANNNTNTNESNNNNQNNQYPLLTSKTVKTNLFSIIHQRTECLMKKTKGNVQLLPMFQFTWQVEITFLTKEINQIYSLTIRLLNIDWSVNEIKDLTENEKQEMELLCRHFFSNRLMSTISSPRGSVSAYSSTTILNNNNNNNFNNSMMMLDNNIQKNKLEVIIDGKDSLVEVKLLNFDPNAPWIEPFNPRDKNVKSGGNSGNNSNNNRGRSGSSKNGKWSMFSSLSEDMFDSSFSSYIQHDD
ncbi:hypothetical protein ABK040_002456 [Willaertia magna]